MWHCEQCFIDMAKTQEKMYLPWAWIKYDIETIVAMIMRVVVRVRRRAMTIGAVVWLGYKATKYAYLHSTNFSLGFKGDQVSTLGLLKALVPSM